MTTGIGEGAAWASSSTLATVSAPSGSSSTITAALEIRGLARREAFASVTASPVTCSNTSTCSGQSPVRTHTILRTQFSSGVYLHRDATPVGMTGLACLGLMGYIGGEGMIP